VVQGGGHVRAGVELDVDGELTEVPELVGAKRADVLVLNDDDLTYAKVRLDEDSLSFGLEHIEAFTDSLPRSIVLASAWDMVRDGELAASRFLDAALRALGVEEHSSVIQGLLGRITTCLSGFLPPAVRRDLAPGTADRLLELARAGPGQGGGPHPRAGRPTSRRHALSRPNSSMAWGEASSSKAWLSARVEGRAFFFGAPTPCATS